MCAWGAAFKSCDALLRRIETNDSSLTELTILPSKTFGDEELDRLSHVLESAKDQRHWKSLSASGHEVSFESLERFGKAMSTSRSQLISVSVGNSSMGDEGVLAFCNGIIQAGSNSKCRLERLDMSYKGFGITGFRKLAEAIHHSCPSLQRLALSRNELVVDDSAVFSDDEVLFSDVQDLDLSACSLDVTFAEMVFPRLRCRTLKLSSNLMGDAAFGVLIQSCGAHLHELSLSACNLSDKAMESLIDMPMPECRLIDLTNNTLTEAGASILGTCLFKGFPNVVSVNLSGNAIGGNGSASIIKGASNGAGLSSLDLSETSCGCNGAILALQNASQMGLTSLRLYNNNLGSEGFLRLADGLRSTSTTLTNLETLDLAGNGAGQDAVVALLQSLLEAMLDDCFKSLKCIIVGGNQGGEEVEAISKKLMKFRPNLDVARDKIKRRDGIVQ